MEQYDNVRILDHILIRHKVAMLRDKNTSSKMFRELISEIAALMTYEGFRNVPIEKVVIEGIFENIEQDMVKKHSIVIVPILRAGLGMVDGVLSMFPSAKVGHIGLYRNEETLEPVEYYCKLPVGVEDKIVIVLDPMLATGGSSSAAVTLLRKRGCKNIKFMAIIAAPEGVKRMAEDHPDVEIFVSTVDRELNEYGYILPGLGDAGDRIYGTK